MTRLTPSSSRPGSENPSCSPARRLPCSLEPSRLNVNAVDGEALRLQLFEGGTDAFEDRLQGDDELPVGPLKR
jgi:hypothetical protein